MQIPRHSLGMDLVLQLARFLDVFDLFAGQLDIDCVCVIWNSHQ